MKKCKKCGALQNDDNSTCIDCEAVLGKALDEAEAAEINERLDDTLEGMGERKEDFYVPLRDKIMGVLSAVGIIAVIILLVLVGRENDRIDADIPDGVIVDRGSGFITILSDSEVDYSYPSALKRKLDNVGMNALISLICLIVALPMLIVPKFMWFIDTLRYRMFYNWDTTPSYFALVVRKAVTYIFFAVGIMGVIYGYWEFF
ncbi:MAG: hypothetical protein IJ325_04500 [Clostridia bacterium]|nr:hypothetical protein [Clostridia bacterium]